MTGMLEERLQVLLLRECSGGSVLFFVHHILFFDLIGICGLAMVFMWFFTAWGFRLPFGCGMAALFQVYVVLLGGCFYVAVHTCLCTQMNENVLPEYLKMVTDGDEWREIALKTNEMARQQGCLFHQIFYSGEQCRRYFAWCIVKSVEKEQYSIIVGDGGYAAMDPELALNAVERYKQNRDLMRY